MTPRQPIGYVVFYLAGGTLTASEFRLLTKEEAVRQMIDILEENRRCDRYADPESPVFDRDKSRQYDECVTQARRLKSMTVSEDDELHVLPVFGTTRRRPTHPRIRKRGRRCRKEN